MAMDITDPHDATAKRVRGKIDMQGGPYIPGTVCRTLQGMDFLHGLVSIDFLKEVLNRRSLQNNGPELSIHLTNSPSMRVSIVKASAAHSAILVPAGVIARLQVMHRLLLTYWDKQEPPVNIIASIMDRPFDRKVPAMLKPLFAEPDAGQEDGEWWACLDALNDAIELDQKFAPDVGELNHLVLSWLLNHEFAHAARKHPEFAEKVLSGEAAFEIGDGAGRRPGTEAELARAMENEADRIAAYLTMLTLFEQAGADENLATGLLRAGYGVNATLALFDPSHISLQLFGKDSGYAHPLVRQDAYFADVADCAEQMGLRQLVESQTLLGGKLCMTALGQLETDLAFKRRFVASGEDCQPAVHALRGSPANMMTLFRERQANTALTLRLTTLINDACGEFRF